MNDLSPAVIKQASPPITTKALLPPKKRFVFGPLPAPGTVTLTTLPAVFGAVDEVSRGLLFREANDSDLVDDGIQIDTTAILGSIPTFLVSCARILGALTLEQEALVYLDPGVFGVLVDETEKLAARKKIHDDSVRAEKSGQIAQEASASPLLRDAVLLRERTRTGLVSALGGSRRAVIDAAAGTSTEEPLQVAAALDALANLLAAVHDSKSAGFAGADRGAATRFYLGPDRVVALRAVAKAVRAVGEPPARPTRAVTQRALDLQDGRVLLLVGIIVRAFRQAHRASTAIALPDLKQLASRFASRSGKRPKKAAAAQATAPAVSAAQAPANDAR